MNIKTLLFISSLFSSVFIGLTIPSFAQRFGHERWHGGNISRFEYHDRPLWRGGRWYHTSYSGRYGWWWVIGSSWYFYPRPIYPYPDPYIPSNVMVVEAQNTQPAAPPAPVAQNWYFCQASKEYYPYVETCPSGWKTVPATPSPSGNSGPPPK